MLRRAGIGTARAAAAALLLITGGCGHLPHWPWHHAPPPPPPPVHELDITGVNTAGAFEQYWERNTLVVDLSGARGTGGIVLKPAAGTSWPVRLAFRVMPGSFGALEVRAAQRVVLPITPAGSHAIDLELSPGVYTPTSSEITVSWGAAAPAAP